MTDDDIRKACRLAKGGDEDAFKLIEKLAETKHARAVILDYFCKPQKRGMPKGKETDRGKRRRTLLEEMEAFIEQAKAEGCKKAVEEGATRAAEWANSYEGLALDSEELRGFGWAITPDFLINARRRGKKRRKDVS